MSGVTASLDPEQLLDPICLFCGYPIEEDDQDCMARDEGRCRP